MSARDDLDLAEVTAKVVQPLIARFLKPGELDEVKLGWQMLRLPLSNEAGAEILVLSLVAKGEEFTLDIVESDDDMVGFDLELVRDELAGRLQDLVACSKFGWGELRR